MTKKWLIATAALALIASGASAEDKKPAAADAAPAIAEKAGDVEGQHGWRHKPKTLEEARAAARKKLEKLDKMTPQEWEAKQKKRAERRQKWQSMTPEEREKHKLEMKERRKDGKKHGTEAAPAAAAAEEKK